MVFGHPGSQWQDGKDWSYRRKHEKKGYREVFPFCSVYYHVKKKEVILYDFR